MCLTGSHPLRAVLRVRPMAQQARIRHPQMKLQAKEPPQVTLRAQKGHLIRAVTPPVSHPAAVEVVGHHPHCVHQHQGADTAEGYQEITPKKADTSMQARQFFSELLGRPLTRTEFKKQKNALKRQLAILVHVSERPENQLPKQEPGEPQPGTSKDSNGSDNVDSSDNTSRTRRNNTQ